MSINAKHFREKIVRPTLQKIELHSPSAEELLMLTWAQETHGATYLQQGWKTIDDGRGVGVGPYSMEPDTINDIYGNFLAYRNKLYTLVCALKNPLSDPVRECIGNLYFATALARVHYLRVPEALPPADRSDLLAIYWDTHYNKNPLAGYPSEAVANYKRYAAL